MSTDVIFAWAMVSDHRATTYECVLRQDGSIECSCPGWIFVRRNQPRRCKHTDRIKDEAATLLAAYKAGRPLERPEVSVPEPAAVMPPTRKGKTSATVPVGTPTRRINLDIGLDGEEG